MIGSARGTSTNGPDPRLASLIWDALGDADSVVNVGAGAGSYEPRESPCRAVEPAITMIRQRTAGAAPVVRACAEAYPSRMHRLPPRWLC